MSEQNTQNTAEERTPYSLEVEPLKFESDAEVKILTSNEFCKLTNEYFKAAFADYEGCLFEFPQGQAPTISLYFNHQKHTDSEIYACEMAANKKIGNSVLDKSRAYDRLVKEGDRYHLTEDGKDIIKPLLAPRYFNNGNVAWQNVATDIVDRSAATYYQPQNAVQLTKVVGIDPKAICTKIYGNKEDGSFLDYSVEVKADLSMRNGFGNTTPNYVLYITKAFNDHISKTYEKLGFGLAGSSIVR